MTTPTASGVNTVTVQVPNTISEGKYGVRLGLPNGSTWKYSQLFDVSKTAKNNESATVNSILASGDKGKAKESEASKTHGSQATSSSKSATATTIDNMADTNSDQNQHTTDVNAPARVAHSGAKPSGLHFVLLSTKSLALAVFAYAVATLATV
ncbi:hypothetical protein H4R26_003817 [Coemansia thaxteri]|uniref:Uncharacterized protein n=1 Tax=Coemansia thaxteri TaxID=2663907 RepID=A0A9W8EEN0_9FUNG|nr:hypothetical protein H4R26_003817 [Coemansia thaxteri]